METEYLNQLKGTRIYYAFMGDGDDWQKAEISSFKIEKVEYVPSDGDDNKEIVFIMKTEKGEMYRREYYLWEWKKFYHDGYIVRANCYHCSISDKQIESERDKYLHKIAVREIEGQDWDARAWQLACQIYAQVWNKNMYGVKEYAIVKTPECAYDFVKAFKEEAIERRVQQMKDFFNNSNN